MTQVESGKEEGAQPTKCDHAGGESGPSSHSEESLVRKISSKAGAGAGGAKKSAVTTISSPHLNQRPRSACVTSSKPLKIYRNGEHRDHYDFLYRQDLKGARTWSAVLDVLSAAISTKYTDGVSIAKVFTIQGKKVLSLSDLECCQEIVVCGTEAYQSLPYGSPSSYSDSHHRKHVGSKTPNMRRADRDAIVKSVIFESPTALDESLSHSHHHHTSRKNPLVKTFSEQDVSNIENSPMTESMSPKMRPRSTHSPKPRPVSAYHHVATVHGMDRRPSPMAGLVSRIPKRIVATPPHNNNRGVSPHFASVASGNCAITNNNMNNRNCAPRRALDMKSSSAERTSRQG